MSESYKPRVLPMLLIAAALTLLVTFVRVVGELQAWDGRWFPSDAGAVTPFGIIWLVPVFGFLFGRRLAQAVAKPPFVASFFIPMFGLLVVVAASLWVFARHQGAELQKMLHCVAYAGPGVMLLALFAWPRAFFALIGYAIAARLPVALVQYLDIDNGWQTHYGRVHASLNSLDASERLWLLTLMQAGLWIPVTVLLGCGFAAVGAATVRRL